MKDPEIVKLASQLKRTLRNLNDIANKLEEQGVMVQITKGESSTEKYVIFRLEETVNYMDNVDTDE